MQSKIYKNCLIFLKQYLWDLYLWHYSQKATEHALTATRIPVEGSVKVSEHQKSVESIFEVWCKIEQMVYDLNQM